MRSNVLLLALGVSSIAACADGSPAEPPAPAPAAVAPSPDEPLGDSQDELSLGEVAAAVEGAVLFNLPVPGGNGRACATCHRPEDEYALTPATVERIYQKNPNDPLFRSIDADDGGKNFTLLRTRGLVRVTVPLPAYVRLTDDPAATSVSLWRSVPTIENVRDTAPYQQDRRAPSLEGQAFSALADHIRPAHPLPPSFGTKIAAFERQLFSSPGARKLSNALADGVEPLPDPDPPLTAFEQQGKAFFDDFCGRCHGGPTQTINGESRLFPPFDGTGIPSAVNIVVSNPPPDGFPTDSPIHTPDRDLPTRRYTITVPGQPVVVLESSDPGTLLTDVESLQTVGGNRVFNRFDIPQLRGVSKTAPYFHDNRARTLEEVVRHYQRFFDFIRVVRGFPMPVIPDESVAPIVAYLKKI